MIMCNGSFFHQLFHTSQWIFSIWIHMSFRVEKCFKYLFNKTLPLISFAPIFWHSFEYLTTHMTSKFLFFLIIHLFVWVAGSILQLCLIGLYLIFVYVAMSVISRSAFLNSAVSFLIYTMSLNGCRIFSYNINYNCVFTTQVCAWPQQRSVYQVGFLPFMK